MVSIFYKGREMAIQKNTTASENAVTEIDYAKKLPESEFEVMMAIWDGTPPVNTAYLMEKVGNRKNWKAPTLISFLVRLEDRGYISSVKQGKERYYSPVASKTKYLQQATVSFVNQYHNGSFVALMDSLYSDKQLSENDIDELLEWLKTRY